MGNYEINLDNLAKRAKMMRASAKRVLAPEQRAGMVQAADKYEAFLQAARAGVVPVTYASEADYKQALQAFVGDTRISMENRDRGAWNRLLDSSIDAILNDTTNLKNYDPDALERLAQEPRLAGKPTGRAWAVLVEEMRAGRIPTRLPKGRALELARLLVQERKHGGRTTESPPDVPAAGAAEPFWRKWLRLS